MTTRGDGFGVLALGKVALMTSTMRRRTVAPFSRCGAPALRMLDERFAGAAPKQAATGPKVSGDQALPRG